MKICIDPGHGGKDSGAVGYRKTFEKDHVLEISQIVGKYAEAHGFEVIYTRTTDKYLTLGERSNIADENHCDIFISIHNNSFKDINARGIESYSYPGSVEGLKISKLVQKEMIKASGLIDRGSKTARFAVLRRTSMPAVLVEICFISNPDEEKLVMDEEFKRNISKAIIKGICQYSGVEFNESNLGDVLPPDDSLDIKTLISSVQKFLNSLGITDYENKRLVEDGVYGQRTESALKKLQDMIGYNSKSKTDENSKVSIMGETIATKMQMKKHLVSVNPNPKINCTVDELVDYFVEEGKKEGVRGDIAFAQALKETGYFRYGGIVEPHQNNFAGLGALNNNAKGDAAAFSTPQIGVRAQIQHLKGYASTEGLKQDVVDPRYDILASRKLIGTASYVTDLNGKWAWPGKNYGQGILQILDKILEVEIDYKALYEEQSAKLNILLEELSELKNKVEQVKNVLNS